MYRINGEDFEVEACGIVGRLFADVGLVWAIDVYGKARKTESMDYVHPKLSFVSLPHPPGASPDLCRLHFRKADSYDPETDEWLGDFYIFNAHHFRSQVRLDRVSPTAFHIRWKGKVDIAPEMVKERLNKPFEIDMEIPFPGILCQGLTERKSRSLLAGKVDCASFHWIPEDKSRFRSAILATSAPVDSGKA